MNGLLTFSRYAFQPNRLQYCGGKDPKYLFDCVISGKTDRGLAAQLGEFNGALPYLKLIAQAHGIADHFDERVVDAYWIGNQLLSGVDLVSYYDHLRERFKKKVSKKTLDLLARQVPAGALPHHSFHVFEVSTRTGSIRQTLEVMNNCRISWGQVCLVDGEKLMVSTKPLIIQAEALTLGPMQKVSWLRQWEGRGFVDNAQVGDWVSSHWGWVCAKISREQVKRLQHFTELHIALANQQL